MCHDMGGTDSGIVRQADERFQESIYWELGSLIPIPNHVTDLTLDIRGNR